MSREPFLPVGLGRVADVDRMHASLTRQLKRIDVWERAVEYCAGSAKLARQWLNVRAKFAQTWPDARATILADGKAPGTREACTKLCDLFGNAMLEHVAELEGLMGRRPPRKAPTVRPSYMARTGSAGETLAGVDDAATRWNAVSWLCIASTALWALQSYRR